MGSIRAKALHCWRDTMRFHAAIAQTCTENAIIGSRHAAHTCGITPGAMTATALERASASRSTAAYLSYTWVVSAFGVCTQSMYVRFRDLERGWPDAQVAGTDCACACVRPPTRFCTNLQRRRGGEAARDRGGGGHDILRSGESWTSRWTGHTTWTTVSQ